MQRRSAGTGSCEPWLGFDKSVPGRWIVHFRRRACPSKFQLRHVSRLGHPHVFVSGLGHSGHTSVVIRICLLGSLIDNDGWWLSDFGWEAAADSLSHSDPPLSLLTLLPPSAIAV